MAQAGSRGNFFAQGQGSTMAARPTSSMGRSATIASPDHGVDRLVSAGDQTMDHAISSPDWVASPMWPVNSRRTTGALDQSIESGAGASGQMASLDEFEEPYAEQLVSDVDFFRLKEEADAMNAAGVQNLREGRAREALQELTRARGLLEQTTEPWGSTEEAERDRRLLWVARAETYGNLGVLHRKCGELDLAAQYLERAVKTHRTVGSNPRTVAAVRLNAAACYLEMGASAGDALRHAQAAVDLGGQLLQRSSPAPGDGGSDISGDAGTRPGADECAMLAVAYHKVAEAHEALKEWSKASHAYTQAYEVVRRSLGPNHHLTKAFEKSTRCPKHVAAPTTLSLPITTPRMLTQPARLPVIPRATVEIPRHNALKYEMGSDVFEPWPPKSLSREERRWYRMAKPGPKQPFRT